MAPTRLFPTHRSRHTRLPPNRTHARTLVHMSSPKSTKRSSRRRQAGLRLSVTPHEPPLQWWPLCIILTDNPPRQATGRALAQSDRPTLSPSNPSRNTELTPPGGDHAAGSGSAHGAPGSRNPAALADLVEPPHILHEGARGREIGRASCRERVYVLV